MQQFLHAKPWIPGGEKLIFIVVVHYWRLPLHQFAHSRTIDEYDITTPVHHVRVTSKINCGDMTVLSQKRPSLATMEKWAIDDCFRFLCVENIIACKKWNNAFVTMNNDFFGYLWCDLPMIFTFDFVAHENHLQITSLVTTKSIFMVTHASFYIDFHVVASSSTVLFNEARAVSGTS